MMQLPDAAQAMSKSFESATMDIRVKRGLSLSESATEKLARAIFIGHFQPGQHLVEVQLAENLGVSRAMLREAFRTLAAEGLIEIRRNYGAYVVQPSPADIEQMSVFRAINEGLAAHLLVAQRNEKIFGELEAVIIALQNMLESDDLHGFLDAHWRYHQLIVEQSGNRFLLQSWNSVSRIIRMYQRNTLDHNRLLRNNIVLLEVFRTASPQRAEAVLRGQIIKTAYELLGREVPEEIRGYVELFIDASGHVQKF